MATLGGELTQSLIHLSDLIVVEDDPKARAALSQKRKQLTKRLTKLIDRTIPEDTKQYRQALEKLEATNVLLVEAREDLEKVAKVITALARVIDLLGKLAAML